MGEPAPAVRWAQKLGAQEGERAEQVEREKKKGKKNSFARHFLGRRRKKKASKGVADFCFSQLLKVSAFSLLVASALSRESQQLACLPRSSGTREEIGRAPRGIRATEVRFFLFFFFLPFDLEEELERSEGGKQQRVKKPKKAALNRNRHLLASPGFLFGRLTTLRTQKTNRASRGTTEMEFDARKRAQNRRGEEVLAKKKKGTRV